MSLDNSYDILVAGPSFTACQERVEHFFEKTILVRFDAVEIVREECLVATDGRFAARLEENLIANRKVLEELIEELGQAGYRRLDDFLVVSQGYVSKLFHAMAHHLDGFISVEAPFYNLEEDSHGISEALKRRLDVEPSRFWLVRIKARSGSGDASRLAFLRDPEKGKEEGE